MISSPPCPTVFGDVRPLSDGGADVIPYVLPLRVPEESMTMTVAEWLGQTKKSKGATVNDETPQWTAVFWRNGEKLDAPHDSLDAALAFLWDGYCDATLSPDHVKGPDGQVAADKAALKADRLRRMDEQS